MYELNDTEKEDIAKIGEGRFGSKREVGISAHRYDGSVCSAQNDVDSAGAEYAAARLYARPFREEILKTGDGGYDMILPASVEVIWLGRNKFDGQPRRSGHLIVNPDEPQRWADIYLIVAGCVDDGFEEIGWATHYQLVNSPMKDFGHGKKYCMHTNDLNKISALKSLTYHSREVAKRWTNDR